jgi:hypothetical protein
MAKKLSEQNSLDMSIEQRKQIWDLVKMLIGISLAISSFVIADTYKSTRDQLEQISNKIDNVEAQQSENLHKMEGRLIRIEYELKLK